MNKVTVSIDDVRDVINRQKDMMGLSSVQASYHRLSGNFHVAREHESRIVAYRSCIELLEALVEKGLTEYFLREKIKP